MSLDHTVLDDARPAVPGRGPEVLAALQTAADLLDEVPGAVHQLGDEQEGELVSTLLRLQGRSAQVTTLVTADAADRGVLRDSDAATTAQWLSDHVGDGVPVEPKTVRMMAAVADKCRDRRNTVITGALLAGSCSVESARTALNQADKVAPVIPTADRDEVLGWFLQIDPSLGAAGLTLLTRRILARYAPDKLSKDDEKLEGTESLSWSTTPTGMTRLVAELSPANAAILKEAITAKSAPRPAKPDAGRVAAQERSGGAGVSVPQECGVHGDLDKLGQHNGGTGAAFGLRPEDASDRTGDSGGSGPAAGSTDQVRDERSPGKRRADALMDLVGAGARAATGDGVQASAATVLLTLDLGALLSGIGGATTTTGDTLDAGAARRLACTADLIPAVLGGPSAPLDVGRRERLATKAIRAAVILRDGGCTFPACDRPPGFCEVHHNRPWWAGGDTCVTNSVLLCGRHHQTVHRKGYVADIQPDGVHWILTPGRMPEHNEHAA